MLSNTKKLQDIGLYIQTTPFTTIGAGTAEWCKAEKDGKQYFIKKFLTPVYPSEELGLPREKYQKRVEKFHIAEETKTTMYNALSANNKFSTLVVPEEVINFQYHICTVAPFITSNLNPSRICDLSEWQRIVLMRTLTLALLNVHNAGYVHGDMKPENVLIYQNPENGSCVLKLIDFDGSFPVSNPPSNVGGDPAYYAPEVYLKAMNPDIQLGQSIDIFALGIIFHYFWTGKVPQKTPEHTIGLCIHNNEPVTIDISIPESLKSIIEQTFIPSPEKRINAETVYKELESMLSEYPIKLVNLQHKTIKEDPPEPPEPKIANVTVLHCDKEYNTLKSFTVEIEYGKTKRICAEDFSGYHLINSEFIRVSVDSVGHPSEDPVRFMYEKNKSPSGGTGKIIAFIVATFIFVYCLTMYGLAQSSLNSHNYAQAIIYMDLFPFYRELFKEEYYDTIILMRKQEGGQNYQPGENSYSAMFEHYRNGRYVNTPDPFDSMENGNPYLRNGVMYYTAKPTTNIRKSQKTT